MVVVALVLVPVLEPVDVVEVAVEPPPVEVLEVVDA